MSGKSDDLPPQGVARRGFLSKAAKVAWVPVVYAVGSSVPANAQEPNYARTDAPNVFTELQTAAAGIDVRRAANPGDHFTFESIQSSDHAAYTTSYGESAVFQGVRDPVYVQGYNGAVTPFGVDRANSSFPALYTVFEADYTYSGAHHQEWYLEHILTDGSAIRRPIAFTVQEDSVSIKGHISSTSFQFLKDDMATPILTIAAEGLVLESGAAIVKTQNNRTLLLQRNSSGTGYVDVVVVDSSNRVLLAPSGVVVTKTGSDLIVDGQQSVKKGVTIDQSVTVGNGPSGGRVYFGSAQDASISRNGPGVVKANEAFHVASTFHHQGTSLGFYNAAPVPRPSGIPDANGKLPDLTQKFNSLVSKLEDLGLLTRV